MPAFLLTAFAYLFLPLSIVLGPFFARCLRWLGIGGAGCPVTTMAELWLIWAVLCLLGGMLALISLFRKRFGVLDALALIGAVPPIFGFASLFS